MTSFTMDVSVNSRDLNAPTATRKTFCISYIRFFYRLKGPFILSNLTLYHHSEILHSAHRVYYVLCTGLIKSSDYFRIVITKTERSLRGTQWILNVIQFGFCLCRVRLRLLASTKQTHTRS